MPSAGAAALPKVVVAGGAVQAKMAPPLGAGSVRGLPSDPPDSVEAARARTFAIFDQHSDSDDANEADESSNDEDEYMPTREVWEKASTQHVNPMGYDEVEAEPAPSDPASSSGENLVPFLSLPTVPPSFAAAAAEHVSTIGYDDIGGVPSDVPVFSGSDLVAGVAPGFSTPPRCLRSPQGASDIAS